MCMQCCHGRFRRCSIHAQGQNRLLVVVRKPAPAHLEQVFRECREHLRQGHLRDSIRPVCLLCSKRGGGERRITRHRRGTYCDIATQYTVQVQSQTSKTASMKTHTSHKPQLRIALCTGKSCLETSRSVSYPVTLQGSLSSDESSSVQRIALTSGQPVTCPEMAAWRYQIQVHRQRSSGHLHCIRCSSALRTRVPGAVPRIDVHSQHKQKGGLCQRRNRLSSPNFYLSVQWTGQFRKCASETSKAVFPAAG